MSAVGFWRMRGRLGTAGKMLFPSAHAAPRLRRSPTIGQDKRALQHYLGTRTPRSSKLLNSATEPECPGIASFSAT